VIVVGMGLGSKLRHSPVLPVPDLAK